MAYGSNSLGSVAHGGAIAPHRQSIQKRWQGIPGMKYISGRQGVGW